MYIIIIMKRHKCVSGLWNVDVQTLIKGDENQNSQNFPNDIRPPKVFGGLKISMLICPGGNRYKVLQLLGFLGSVRSLRVLLVSLVFCRVPRGSIGLQAPRGSTGFCYYSIAKRHHFGGLESENIRTFLLYNHYLSSKGPGNLLTTYLYTFGFLFQKAILKSHFQKLQFQKCMRKLPGPISLQCTVVV